MNKKEIRIRDPYVYTDTANGCYYKTPKMPLLIASAKKSISITFLITLPFGAVKL